MRNLYTFITFFTIALYLVVAIMVLRVWRQGKAQRRFFFLLVFSAIWVTHIFLEFSTRNNFQLYKLLNYSEPIVASIVSYLLAIFALHFPRNNEKLSIFKEIVLFIPIIILAIANISNKIFIAEDYNIWVLNKGWYVIYISVLIIYFLILAGGTLVRKYIELKGFSKLQLKYLLLGYMVSVTLALYTSIHSALIHRLSDEQYLIFANVVVFFALSSSYAIIKYRLMDIRVVLRKGFVHMVSLIILLAIYTYMVLVVQDYFGLERTYTALLSVLVIALTIHPLRKRLFKGLDSFFFEKEAEKESLTAFTSLSTPVLKMEELFEKAKIAITSGLDVLEVEIFILDRNQGKFQAEYPDEIIEKEFVSEEDEMAKYLKVKKEIVIKEEIPYLTQGSESREQEQLQDIEKELKNKNVEVVVPLGEEDIFALMFLGPKKSQEAFTVQDIRFLNSFARQFTLYLGNALLYKQAMERVSSNA